MQNQVFNENMRSNKDSGQLGRTKLKHLHYLNKMIEKCNLKNFISVKFHASSQNYFKGFV